MCNNREFGVINKKSYLRYVSCAMMCSIFLCFVHAMLEQCLRYQEEGYYLLRCRESNWYLNNSIGLNKYIVRLFLFKWPTFLNIPKQALHADLDINGIEGITQPQVTYHAVSHTYSNLTQEFVNLVFQPKETC